MSIRYSGIAYRITSTLEETIVRLLVGSNPEAEPIADGTVEVNAGGAQVDIEDGSFTLTVADRPDVFQPYRLKITERRADPCADERTRLRLMRSELQVARREGLSSRVIRGLGQQVAEAEQQLSNCVRRNAPADDEVAPLIFRSIDMYRTGDALEDDLRIYIRALSAEDWEYLRTLGYDVLSEFINYWSLKAEIEKNLPAGVKVDLVSPVGIDAIRLDIRTVVASFSVRGHINVILEPSVGPDYRRFVEFIRSDVDLHGLVGEVAGLIAREDELADNAVRSFSGGFNNGLARQLQPLFDKGYTLTICSIVAGSDGLRISAAVGLLKGGRPDPCQYLRNQFMIDENELSVALREGLSSHSIAAQRKELQRIRQAVDDCRAQH
jgi:hypothetical protein